MQDGLGSYLRAIAGEPGGSSFLEIRYRVTSDTLAAEFHRAHDQAALIASIRERSPNTDVYVGCAPRWRRSGTKNGVSNVWVLWAECDGAAAAAAARQYSPEPSIVIASGSGPNVRARAAKLDDRHKRLAQRIGRVLRGQRPVAAQLLGRAV